MLTQHEGSGKVYLSVIEGKLRQKVTEDTEGAVKRDWKAPDGSTGTKWELVYNSVTGTITDLRTKDSDYGKFLVIEFDGGESLSLHTDHRFFSDTVKKLASCDLTQPVEMSPYDFEDDAGKRIVGMSIKQDGHKVKDFFYDFDKKKNLNGFPEPDKDKKKTYDKDDWKAYFLQVKKFLLAYVTLTLAPTLKKVEAEEIPVVKNEEKATINLDDVPF